MAGSRRPSLYPLPLWLAAVILLVGGVLLLHRADAQARDTIRKHHLEDMERSLYVARDHYGTFPPYDQPTWCGRLHDTDSEGVRTQIEAALRRQNEKYANPAKPFPTDPRYPESGYDYFYWKRSPALFEFYAVLEADRNANRTTTACPTTPDGVYDYGINSGLREDRINLTP